MKIHDAVSPQMTPEMCRKWIDEKVFPLQPETYRHQYPGFPGAVGLEIEMLPLFDEPTSTAPRGVPLQGQADSLAAVL